MHLSRDFFHSKLVVWSTLRARHPQRQRLRITRQNDFIHSYFQAVVLDLGPQSQSQNGTPFRRLQSMLYKYLQLKPRKLKSLCSLFFSSLFFRMSLLRSRWWSSSLRMAEEISKSAELGSSSAAAKSRSLWPSVLRWIPTSTDHIIAAEKRLLSLVK